MRVILLLALAGCAGGAKDGEPTDSRDCSTIALDLPATRGEAAGGWDEARNRLVFFGGDAGTPIDCRQQTSFVDETWSFDLACDAFIRLAPAVSPSARGRHAVAIDESTGKMWMHGGRTRVGTSGLYDQLGDLWVFDLATDAWSEVAATNAPSNRSNHTMSAVNGKLLLYGGNTSRDGAFFTPLGDLWSFDPATSAWTQLEPAGPAPQARLFHAAATDGSMLYVYGGGDANAFFGPFFGDLWAYDPQTNAWTQLHDGAGPPASRPRDRFWPNLEHDAANDQLALFGGHDSGNLGNTNQIWTFSLSTGDWSRVRQGDTHQANASGFCDFPADFVDADLSSPERRNASVAGLTDAGELVVFGGKTDCGIINDLWSYEIASDSWNERSVATAGEICLRASRQCVSMCF